MYFGIYLLLVKDKRCPVDPNEIGFPQSNVHMRLEYSCLNYIIYDVLMFINLFLGKH